MIIDSREKGLVPTKLEKLGWEGATLPCGDYWIFHSDNCKPKIIEMMQINDMAGKIVSGRLWEQARKCLDVSDDVIFLILGGGRKLYGGVSRKSIAEIMATLCLSGIQIVSLRGAEEAVRFLTKLAEGAVEPDVDHLDRLIRLKPDKMDAKQEAVYCLMGIRGIGEKTAREVLKGKSISQWLKEHDGTGSKIERRVYDILNTVV